jgi:hypothetical protein
MNKSLFQQLIDIVPKGRNLLLSKKLLVLEDSAIPFVQLQIIKFLN